MTNLDFNEFVYCPRCKGILESVLSDSKSAVWFCQKCVRGWTKEELAQNPHDLENLSGSFTTNYGIAVSDVSKLRIKLGGLSGVSEVTNCLVGLNRARPRKQNTVKVSGNLKGALKPL